MQVVEKKTRSMEDEIFLLQKNLEERNGQLEASASNANRVRFTGLSIHFLLMFCTFCTTFHETGPRVEIFKSEREKNK